MWCSLVGWLAALIKITGEKDIPHKKKKKVKITELSSQGSYHLKHFSTAFIRNIENLIQNKWHFSNSTKINYSALNWTEGN